MGMDLDLKGRRGLEGGGLGIAEEGVDEEVLWGWMMRWSEGRVGSWRVALVR